MRLSGRGTRPGILSLFPTFALLIVGAKDDRPVFREACLAGAKTLPACLAFLAAWFLLGGCCGDRVARVGGLTTRLPVAVAVVPALGRT